MGRALQLTFDIREKKRAEIVHENTRNDTKGTIHFVSFRVFSWIVYLPLSSLSLSKLPKKSEQ
ncbi:MAG: hypothetical protein AUG51_16345 [Acidobacteria bacterium 13_1_20CM_3_53_8]|nr:MAG: hypothetical protein AUG51_16345 [Acidobacteria bacterium 13_1_20CM_3_53_8]